MFTAKIKHQNVFKTINMLSRLKIIIFKLVVGGNLQILKILRFHKGSLLGDT